MRTPNRGSTARLLAPALIVAASLVAACSDRRPVDPAPQPQAFAYVTLSDSAPSAGDTVRVAVRLRADLEIGSVGSFSATLRYDRAALTMASEAAVGDGALRAVNLTEAGVVRAAGASADGFGDAPLFVVQFRVARPQGIRDIRLDFSEINAVGRADLRRNLKVSPVVASEPRR